MRSISLADFREHYWLKAELVVFARECGLQSTGGKFDIAERIGAFIASGHSVSIEPATEAPSKARDLAPEELTRSTVVGRNWRLSQHLRAFFEREIGPQFHFNQVMRDFVKHGAGKTLDEAIAAWHAAKNAPRSETEIAPQFEYNRHTREFFKAHPNATRKEAIAAWRDKRAQRKPRTG